MRVHVTKDRRISPALESAPIASSLDTAAVPSLPAPEKENALRELATHALPEDSRLWSSAAGKHQREGAFGGVDGSIVKIVGKDGRTINVDYGKLSEEDRTYVRTRIAPGLSPTGEAAFESVMRSAGSPAHSFYLENGQRQLKIAEMREAAYNYFSRSNKGQDWLDGAIAALDQLAGERGGRTWTSRDGRLTRTGDLVAVTDNSDVVIRLRDNGQITTVPLQMLSDSDNLYATTVRKQLAHVRTDATMSEIRNRTDSRAAELAPGNHVGRPDYSQIVDYNNRTASAIAARNHRAGEVLDGTRRYWPTSHDYEPAS